MPGGGALLERTWHKAHDRGVTVRRSEPGLRPDARRFLREFDASYLNVRDPGSEVARRWGLVGLPGACFIDADGNVVAHILGAASAAELREGIQVALSGRSGRVDRDGAGPAFKLDPGA